MARLSERLSELVAGGILIVDGFPDRQDDQVAFRTLIQLDGDVSLMIHAEALARADFAALLQAHQRHVCEILDQHRTRLTWFGRAFVGGCVTTGFFGGRQAGSGLEGIELLILRIPDAAMPYAAGLVGAVLLYALSDAGLRAVLRKLAFGRPLLHPRV